MKLGEQASMVRPLKGADWTYGAFLYIRLGGNANFRKYMHYYSLNDELPAFKYNTKAAYYYRSRVFPGFSPSHVAGRDSARTAAGRGAANDR